MRQSLQKHVDREVERITASDISDDSHIRESVELEVERQTAARKMELTKALGKDIGENIIRNYRKAMLNDSLQLKLAACTSNVKDFWRLYNQVLKNGEFTPQLARDMFVCAAEQGHWNILKYYTLMVLGSNFDKVYLTPDLILRRIYSDVVKALEEFHPELLLEFLHLPLVTTSKLRRW